MKIIDNLNKRYTKSKDFKVDDWFYDEIGGYHYHIVYDADVKDYSLYRIESDAIVDTDPAVERLIECNIEDTSQLVRIPKDRVHIVFGDIPRKED